MPGAIFRSKSAVSIHAPARGATHPGPHYHSQLRFQSTRPRGARPLLCGSLIYRLMFQSTRPRGARQPDTCTCVRGMGFNPRAREGRDKGLTTAVRAMLVSIHAPARGATQRYPVKHTAKIVSIHAPARGATQPHGMPRCRANVSIHAPARGATRNRPA